VLDERGVLIGKAPGAFEIARSNTPRRVSLVAPGHVRRVEEIVPDRDSVIRVTLEPSPRDRARPDARGARRPDDLEPWR
jgi:hypothetical protein